MSEIDVTKPLKAIRMHYLIFGSALTLFGTLFFSMGLSILLGIDEKSGAILFLGRVEDPTA